MTCISYITPKIICETIEPLILPFLAKYRLQNNLTLYDAIFIGSAFNGYKIAVSGLEVIIPIAPIIQKSFLSNNSNYQKVIWSIHVVERSIEINDSFTVRKNLSAMARQLPSLFFNCELIPKPQTFNNSEQFELRVYAEELIDRD